MLVFGSFGSQRRSLDHLMLELTMSPHKDIWNQTQVLWESSTEPPLQPFDVFRLSKTVSVLVTIAMMKPHDEKDSFCSQFHITVYHQKQWGQKLMRGRADAEAVEGAPHYLALHGLTSLRYRGSQDHQPRDGPTHQSLIKKMSHRLAYSPILWRHFLSGGSLLSDD